MKYLVAADGDTLDAKVARRFGHATAHLIVDTEDWSVEAIGGDPEELPQHGLGRFQDHGLAGIISGNIGPHAWQDIVDLGLTLFIARGMSVKEALEKVNDGQIPPAEGPTLKRSIHEGHGNHHHGDEHEHHDHHGEGEGRGRHRHDHHGEGEGHHHHDHHREGEGRGRHRHDE